MQGKLEEVDRITSAIEGHMGRIEATQTQHTERLVSLQSQLLIVLGKVKLR